MDKNKAKEILLLYCPWVDKVADPETLEALECARHDAELGRWLEQHSALQRRIRLSLENIDCPEYLLNRILANCSKPARDSRVWLGRWRVLVGMTALILVFGVVSLLLSLGAPNRPESFPTFRSRTVRAVQRTYPMEMLTNNLVAVQSFFATNQAPSDFVLPESVGQLPAIGCAILDSGANKVSLICFECGRQRELYIFIAKEESFKGSPPPGKLEFERIGKLMTASWTKDNHTYVLAAPEDEGALRKRFR